MAPSYTQAFNEADAYFTGSNPGSVHLKAVSRRGTTYEVVLEPGDVAVTQFEWRSYRVRPVSGVYVDGKREAAITHVGFNRDTQRLLLLINFDGISPNQGRCSSTLDELSLFDA